MLSVKVANGIATVDVDEHFAVGATAAACWHGSPQLVRTLTGLQGVTRVQLLLNGERDRGPIPRHLDEPPDHLSASCRRRTCPSRSRPLQAPRARPRVKKVQQRLIDLGYLLPR